MRTFRFNATFGLIVAMILGFLFAWLPGGSKTTLEWFACTGDFSKAWTFLTYPFFDFGTSIGIIFVIFTWIWLYQIGSDIESKFGTKGLLLSFFGHTALAGLCVSLTARSLGATVPLTSAWLPVSALTCIWAGSNPSRQVLLMGAIPVAAKWLAVLTAAIDLLTFGAGRPLVGVAAVVPCAVGWFQGAGGIGLKKPKPVASGRGQRSQDPKEFEKFIDKVRSREKDREERERLRKLFEGSSSDESSGPENRP